MTAELLTFEDARKRLGMSERQLRKRVAERAIAVVRDGRWLRFEPAAIEEYIAARRVPALRVVNQTSACPPDDQHLDELVAKFRLRR